MMIKKYNSFNPFIMNTTMFSKIRKTLWCFSMLTVLVINQAVAKTNEELDQLHELAKTLPFGLANFSSPYIGTSSSAFNAQIDPDNVSIPSIKEYSDWGYAGNGYYQQTVFFTDGTYVYIYRHETKSGYAYKVYPHYYVYRTATEAAQAAYVSKKYTEFRKVGYLRTD